MRLKRITIRERAFIDNSTNEVENKIRLWLHFKKPDMVDEQMMTGQQTSMKISYMYHRKRFPSEENGRSKIMPT